VGWAGSLGRSPREVEDNLQKKKSMSSERHEGEGDAYTPLRNKRGGEI